MNDDFVQAFMSDDDFVQAFMGGTLPPGQFRHRDHLRLAWLLVRRLGAEPAGAAVADGIRHFAATHGQAAKYHETMTRFWVRLVGHVARAHPELDDFDGFLAAFPHILDKELPYRHWRRETMLSAEARTHWVEPDLLALPA